MKKSIFGNDKFDKIISGKCRKIIAYNQPENYCGTMLVNNPGWMLVFFYEQNGTLKLKFLQEFVDFLELLQISLFKTNSLISSSKEGKISICQKYTKSSKLKFETLYENKTQIQNIAFLETEQISLLMFLDYNSQVSQIIFKNIERRLGYEIKDNIFQNIKCMVPSKDQKSILLFDKQSRIIIISNDKYVVEIDPEQKELLFDQQGNILRNIQSIDFDQDDTNYSIYMIDDNLHLYKFSYSLGDKYFNIKQIINLEQNLGESKHIFVYPNKLNYPYEVTVVQLHSVNSFQFTNELRMKNLWQNSADKLQMAYLYTYQKLGSQYVHMIHHIAKKQQLGPTDKFEYDPSKGYIHAFVD